MSDIDNDNEYDIEVYSIPLSAFKQSPSVPYQASSPEPSAIPNSYSQYVITANKYRAAMPTVKSLPAGCYDLGADDTGVYATRALDPSGLILDLPDMRSDHVIKVIERFWDSEKDYKEGNQFVIGGAAFKSGIMLYGPPGSGKSCTIKIVSKKLVERGGLVFYSASTPGLLVHFLTTLSQIEPNRKCIVILEDLDSLIRTYGEAYYLEMLDSAKTIDNVLFIATTNYPDRLDPRIYNRPGRFSHVVKIGLPTRKAREAFLKAVLKDHRDVQEIVDKTDKFTIDHLSALICGVYREKKDLNQEIERLKTLFVMPKAEEDKQFGLGLGFTE